MMTTPKSTSVPSLALTLRLRICAGGCKRSLKLGNQLKMNCTECHPLKCLSHRWYYNKRATSLTKQNFSPVLWSLRNLDKMIEMRSSSHITIIGGDWNTKLGLRRPHE